MQRTVQPLLYALVAAAALSVSACIPPLMLGRQTVVVSPTPTPNTVTITPARVLMMEGESVKFSARIDRLRKRGQWSSPGVTFGLDEEPYGDFWYDLQPQRLTPDDDDSSNTAILSRTSGMEEFKANAPSPQRTYGPAVTWTVKAFAYGLSRPESEAKSQVYEFSTARAPLTLENLALIPGLRDSLRTSDETLRAMTPAELVSLAEKSGWFVTEGVRRELETLVVPPPPASASADPGAS